MRVTATYSGEVIEVTFSGYKQRVDIGVERSHYIEEVGDIEVEELKILDITIMTKWEAPKELEQSLLALAENLEWVE